MQKNLEQFKKLFRKNPGIALTRPLSNIDVAEIVPAVVTDPSGPEPAIMPSGPKAKVTTNAFGSKLKLNVISVKIINLDNAFRTIKAHPPVDVVVTLKVNMKPYKRQISGLRKIHDSSSDGYMISSTVFGEIQQIRVRAKIMAGDYYVHPTVFWFPGSAGRLYIPSFNENQTFDDGYSNNSEWIFQGPIEPELFYNNSENLYTICLILLYIFYYFINIRKSSRFLSNINYDRMF